MYHRWRMALPAFGAPLLIAAAEPPVDPSALTAAGARAGENAVRQAGDAFGTVVGREEIGLYDADQVRGFSPSDAGNLRIDGLFFDSVIPLSDRIGGSTVIRVGPSALGSPFPAPTGIVDLGLRVPGNSAGGSALIGGNSWGGVSAEVDVALPVTSTLSIGGGVALVRERYYNRTAYRAVDTGLIAAWRPSAAVTVVPFIGVIFGSDDAGPEFVPAGDFLPSPLPGRRFTGPGWAVERYVDGNAGITIDADAGGGWRIKAGLFHSWSDISQGASNLMADVMPAGDARQLVFIDPPLLFAATSGEVRATRTIVDGPRTHRLHLSVRGRLRTGRFGGTDIIDLGPIRTDAVQLAPRPDSFAFTEQSRDRVQQLAGGLAYEGRWDGVGELSLGVQYNDYRKRIGLPDAKVETRARPLLVNVNTAISLSPALEAYGGFVTGLEESGVAPNNAVNRNEALPAIRTRQFDAGLRWAVANDIKLVAGVFDVSKPYFNLGVNGRFDALGRVVNRGVETSLAGPVTRHLSLVAGAVLLWPRVTGEAVERGLVGPRPVGALSQRLEFSADWRPPFAPGLSLDVVASHRSPETTTVNNRVSLPRRTFVDAGARYAFKLGNSSAVARLQVGNLLNVLGPRLRGAGAYGQVEGRVAQGYLTVDF
jgi:iron complex outermembrane receptor protein